jgi:peroxiredoxin
MAAVHSTMLELGTRAPDFTLPSATGGKVSPEDFAGAPALLVMFICNHCPFVKHVQSRLVELTRDFRKKGVAVVAINANDWTAYPDDSPEKMAQEAREHGYNFPYLYDESQAAAQAYRAACTPDFFLFDTDRRLVYRGQMDDSRPGNNVPVTGKDLSRAVDALLAGRPVDENQRPSIGCNIKWRKGNEPDDFLPKGT